MYDFFAKSKNVQLVSKKEFEDVFPSFRVLLHKRPNGSTYFLYKAPFRKHILEIL